MANAWILDMEYLRILLRDWALSASLRHACFYIRSIEGPMKVNDSTGNLIAQY